MKRDISPLFMAILLVFGCAVFRLLSSLFPEVVPNVSPLLALAFVGGICLPRRWGWMVGAAAFIVTDLALLPTNYRVFAPALSWWTVLSLLFYVAAAFLGVAIASRRSLVVTLLGSVTLSVLFYVLANSFSWAGEPAYPAGLAGWWQANTVGLHGYAPTWTFLRNGVAGDLFFTVVFLGILDRALLFGRIPAPVTRPSASR